MFYLSIEHVSSGVPILTTYGSYNKYNGVEGKKLGGGYGSTSPDYTDERRRMMQIRYYRPFRWAIYEVLPGHDIANLHEKLMKRWFIGDQEA